nr:BBF_HP1_G0030680.mRNA.1.CDS.1 [Saccharomyces cerevisiae]
MDFLCPRNHVIPDYHLQSKPDNIHSVIPIPKTITSGHSKTTLSGTRAAKRKGKVLIPNTALEKNPSMNTDATRIAWRLADPNPATRYTMDDLFNEPFLLTKSRETSVEPK